jgi:(E)-4-hydroxy-3-methylbut-2-enyl-diphosphate synthase
MSIQYYTESLSTYKRFKTREVAIGNIIIGGGRPVRVQTMTTTDTMDTEATVAQVIRCIEAGAEMVRITAPSKKEAENLANIKNLLRSKGFDTPLIADIHFTPNAAEVAATIVEKVRVNPGNYVDKKKFEQIEYTDQEYIEEIERIKERFTPLVRICKTHGTAMRIGTNHGSLSDRIMSRYGDTAIGMVESAMEFLRIARGEDFHQIVLSMKSSNPQVMVQAYRLLIQQMLEEFGETYPLHLGVTEAGDGEDGRIKSAIGIGTLLEDGIGDTIRVSLTEDPEFEIPVCKDIVKRYNNGVQPNLTVPPIETLTYSPFEYVRRVSNVVSNIGDHNVPVVIADLHYHSNITPKTLEPVGYTYDTTLDKWHLADATADYLFIGDKTIDFALPGTIGVIQNATFWMQQVAKDNFYPLFDNIDFIDAVQKHPILNFVAIDCYSTNASIDDHALLAIAKDETVVFCLNTQVQSAIAAIRSMITRFANLGINHPVIIEVDSHWETIDEHLIHFATTAGSLLLDGMGDGLFLGLTPNANAHMQQNISNVSGRNYIQISNAEQFLNATAFGILQATRTRISKTEYISCPSCGRTLFELQETTARIRKVTNHLKGLKIAIMGCIVNGPGEMADADFGYVGSGVGKITLYKGKEIMKRNIDSDVAVDELIQLLKDHNAWVDPK